MIIKRSILEYSIFLTFSPCSCRGCHLHPHWHLSFAGISALISKLSKFSLEDSPFLLISHYNLRVISVSSLIYLSLLSFHIAVMYDSSTSDLHGTGFYFLFLLLCWGPTLTRKQCKNQSITNGLSADLTKTQCGRLDTRNTVAYSTC